MKIQYEIKRIEQGDKTQDCVQVSVMQLLNYYGVVKTLEQLKNEVPVYKDNEGNLLGTSIGHMGQYLLSLGVKVKFHSVDVEIFERTWNDLSTQEISKKLENRKGILQNSQYNKEIVNFIIEGFIGFLKQGGEITFPIIDEKYLVEQLNNGPFITQVCWNFLNTANKKDMNGKYDSEKGFSWTHAFVVSGYENGKFLLIDSDWEFGGERWVDASLLIASIYMAQVNYDGLLISLSK